MLILTGPQGSGNHLFSKVFALHDEVFGWQSLLNTYWEGHHHEPFADTWNDPELLEAFDWDCADYFVTSISCPYVVDGEPVEPNFVNFINEASNYCKVQLAIIGRDQNILEAQQNRVRGKHTTPMFLNKIKSLVYMYPTNFISNELLYLYGKEYLQSIAKELDWPIAWWHEELEHILDTNTNAKYVQPVKEYWLDNEVKKAIKDSKC